MLRRFVSGRKRFRRTVCSTDVTQEPPTPYSEETLEQAEERRKREAREKEEKRTKEEERKREEARKKEEEVMHENKNIETTQFAELSEKTEFHTELPISGWTQRSQTRCVTKRVRCESDLNQNCM